MIRSAGLRAWILGVVMAGVLAAPAAHAQMPALGDTTKMYDSWSNYLSLKKWQFQLHKDISRSSIADSTLKAWDGSLVAGDSTTLTAPGCGFMPYWVMTVAGYARIFPRGIATPVTLTVYANIPECAPVLADSVRLIAGATGGYGGVRLPVAKR